MTSAPNATKFRDDRLVGVLAHGAKKRGEAAKVEPTVVTAMSALVQQAREKHEAEMIRFCEEYHAQRGERAVTRPSFIPDNVDDHKAKVQGILDNLISKAEDERLASVKALRLQLLSDRGGGALDRHRFVHSGWRGRRGLGGCLWLHHDNGGA